MTNTPKQNQREKPFSDQSNKINTQIDLENLKQIQYFKEWMQQKRYSTSTISTYIHSIQTLFRFLDPKKYFEITDKDVQNFVMNYIIPQNLSFSYQNQIVNASKLFFKITTDSQLNIEKLERPRREYKLPNVLSKEEIRSILNALENPKHKMMLVLIYACGLRRSELINLKPANIDSKRHLLHIINSKGKKIG